MSVYREYYLKGVVKPEYSDDIAKAVSANDWRAGEKLKELLDKNEIYEMRCPVMPDETYSFDGTVIAPSSYDKAERTLHYATSYNSHGFSREDMARLVRCVLAEVIESVEYFRVKDETFWDKGSFDLTEDFRLLMKHVGDAPDSVDDMLSSGSSFLLN